MKTSKNLKWLKKMAAAEDNGEISAGCFKRGLLKMRHVHVYRVVSMIETDVMTTSDNEACQVGLDIAVKPETGFRRPDCKFIAVVQRGGNHAKAPADHPKAR